MYIFKGVNLLNEKLRENKLENNICKLVLRAFNDECDIILSKLTIDNIKRLDIARKQINKLIILYII